MKHNTSLNLTEPFYTRYPVKESKGYKEYLASEAYKQYLESATYKKYKGSKAYVESKTYESHHEYKESMNAEEYKQYLKSEEFMTYEAYKQYLRSEGYKRSMASVVKNTLNFLKTKICKIYDKDIISLANLLLAITLIFVSLYMSKNTAECGELPGIFDRYFGYLPDNIIMQEIAKKEAYIFLDELLTSIKKESLMYKNGTGEKLDPVSIQHLFLKKIWQAPYLPQSHKEFYDFSSVYNQMLDMLRQAYEKADSQTMKKRLRMIIIITVKCAEFKMSDPKTPDHEVFASIIKSLKDEKLW